MNVGGDELVTHSLDCAGGPATLDHQRETTMNDVIAKLVGESGNSFHCRVANALRDRGWTTVMSSYYIDAGTDKAREVDLIVEKAYRVDFEQGRPKTIRLRLYVECKYITQHVVFWFDSRDDDRAHGWLYRNTPFRKDNTLLSEHHHMRGVTSVAKLFASEGKRNEDNDPIFRALNQVLNGYVHNKGGELLIPARNTEGVTLLEYPVIVFSDFSLFYRTDVKQSREPVLIDDNFLLELNYAFVDKQKNGRRDYFLVDMVAFDGLNTFLQSLDHEIKHVQMLVGD